MEGKKLNLNISGELPDKKERKIQRYYSLDESVYNDFTEIISKSESSKNKVIQIFVKGFIESNKHLLNRNQPKK